MLYPTVKGCTCAILKRARRRRGLRRPFRIVWVQRSGFAEYYFAFAPDFERRVYGFVERTIAIRNQAVGGLLRTGFLRFDADGNLSN